MLLTIRHIGRREFALSDVYADSDRLARLHPENRHIEAKIRQQLQKLRDMGLISFLGGGKYEVVGD